MKKQVSDLAIFGGAPLFERVLPVGQINVPSWEKFQKAARGIFARRYYTNHWILTQELEEKLCGLFQTRHAVTMTNATVGIALACKALGLEGKVIVPAFTFAATVQALTWAGLEPVFCDVDAATHNITRATVEPLLDKDGVCAILGVHLWGNACDVEGLESLAKERDIPVFYDAAHAVGCSHGGKPIGNFGACEIFSFHATKILSATEGGCVTTNDNELAERLRNLRASNGRRRDVPVPVNGNGRFSELQAAFCLLSLEDFPKNCAENAERMAQYGKCLAGIPGIRPMLPARGERHNNQYVTMEIDAEQYGMERDRLVRVLLRENIYARRYFVPGLHKSPPYVYELPQYVNALPTTDALCRKVMQLPSGSGIGHGEIEKICAMLYFIHAHADQIGRQL